MQKRQSHGYARSYFGELDADPIIAWLNREDRVRDPIEKLVRLDAALGDVRRLVLGQHAGGEEIQATVGAIVRRYEFAVAPVVGRIAPGSWEVDWKLVGKMPPSPGLAFTKLLHLASRGLLDRVRQCPWEECGKWFFARFVHQECCSTRCQQKLVRSTEKWKKHKREYMQRLRAEKKQRERRQLELSKPKRKGNRR
jgi:hypothetical protein